MILVIESMLFQALFSKYTKIMVNCIIKLVTHKATEGVDLPFSRLKIFGKVLSFAAAYGIWAIIIVNASQEVSRAIITPKFITHPPQEPTISCKIGPVDGLLKAPSWATFILPNGSNESSA